VLWCRFAWEFAGLPITDSTWVKRDASDPYNIAWAAPGVTLEDTWLGMEDAHEAGLVKNIGVSNYSASTLMDLLRYAKRVKPAVHQFEGHPMFQRRELVEIGRKYGIHATMYSILGSGKEGPLQDPVIRGIAEKHGVSPAAVCIAWGLSSGDVSVLAKSTNAERIASNFAVEKVKLDAEDLEKIIGLDKGLRTCSMVEYWQFPSHV
jgi:diketogulonate reductase-like aldo/keto reductase